MSRTTPAWTVAGSVALALTGAMTWFIYLVSFVDDRWVGFVLASLFTAVPAWIATGALAYEGAEITLPRRKPRGWRRMRREAEERAYIRDLEKELGL